jgi:bifunctional non-homologous end joining protein LigD
VPPRSSGTEDVTLDGVTFSLTHPDRVVFPDAGITKGEVVEYYRTVAAVMVPELAGRPLTLERFTKSVDQGGFFQKHWQKHYPAWLDSLDVRGKTRVRYPVVDNAAGLVYLANQGGVAFHIWTSRKAAPVHPDEIVFDLDPPDGGFALVRKTALLLREVLDELGLRAFVKTTGSKGLHVICPLDGKAPFPEVHALCADLASLMTSRHPELITTEFYKKDRKGRLFFDTLRNAPGATYVAAYSLRGRPGAPVSAPITWAEVEDAALRPDGFTLRDIRARLDAAGDPWATLREHAGSVAAARHSMSTRSLR